MLRLDPGSLGFTVLPLPKVGGEANPLAPGGVLGFAVLPLPKAGGAGNAPAGELGLTVLPLPKAGGAGNAPAPEEGALGFAVLPLPKAGGEPNPAGPEGELGVALGAGLPPGVGRVGPTVCALATVASADAIAEARTSLESDVMGWLLRSK